MQQQPLPDQIFVSIDTEKLGPRLGDPLIQIGVTVGHADKPHPLDYRRWSLEPVRLTNDGNWPYRIHSFDGTVMPAITNKSDQNTMERFWSKHMDILLKIQSESVSMETGLIGFANYYNKLFDGNKRDVTILCDNPAFDLGAIDYHLFITGIRTLPIKQAGLMFVACEDPHSPFLSEEQKIQIDQTSNEAAQNWLKHQQSQKKEGNIAHFADYDSLVNYYKFFATKTILSPQNQNRK